MTRSFNKDTIKNIIFAIAVFVIFFGGLELQQRIRYYLKEGEAYYLYYGGSRGLLAIKKYYYRLSSLISKRKVESGSKRPDLIIAAIGGSTTYWIYSPETCYIAQIERILATTYPSRRFLVYNWGTPASTSLGDLKRLGNNYLSGLRMEMYPDILIIHSGLNDAYASEGVSKDWDSIYHSFPVRLNYMLKEYSLFYRCMWERVNNNRPSPQKKTVSGPDYKKHIDFFKKRYRANLMKIIGICRSNDIKPILSVQPLRTDLWNSIEWKEKRFTDSYKEFCEVEKSVAEENHIPFVDLRNYFNEELKDNFKYFNDLVHFNLEGSKKAAEIFLDVIKNLEPGLL